MKDYLILRVQKEFKETDSCYQELFDQWLNVWDTREIHNQLYSCYVRLQVLCVLLRSCIQYKMIDNISLKTKEGNESLLNFCNYVIHRESGSYKDNRDKISNNHKKLEIYLSLDTDLKPEISFVISDNLPKIRKVLEQILDSGIR